MKKNSMPFLLLLWLCFWWTPANADTNKLDNTLRLVGTQFKNLPSGTEVYFNNTIYFMFRISLKQNIKWISIFLLRQN